MKTSTEGKPVANRHRPYSKNQFSQRYLRLVDAPLWEDLDTNTENAHLDPHCNCIRCYQDDHDYVNKTDYARQAIRNRLFLPACTSLDQLLPTQVWMNLRGQVPQYCAAPAPLKGDRISPQRLPVALAQYATYFDRNYKPQYPLPDSLLNFLEDEEAIGQLLRLNQTMLQWSEDVMIDFLLMQPFWVRDLHTWVDPQTQFQERFRSMIDHLFVVYPVPEFLYQGWKRRPLDRMGAWHHKALEPNATWLQWFILLAQGASLHDAGPMLGWDVPRKFPAYLQQVPAHLSFEDACLFAEMLRLEVSQLPFERIHALQCFHFHPSQDPSKWAATAFARETLVWLGSHCAAFTDNELETVLEYAVHLFTEIERTGEIQFSWHGCSAARVLELSLAYQASHKLPYARISWYRKGWDFAIEDVAGCKWTVTELCTGKELFQEGRAMRHCVAGYARGCADGRSAIFSLRCNSERKVTIELRLPCKTVVQAKGPCNRNANDGEKAVIAQWMRGLGV